jgi:hypothetical protein
MYLSGRGAFGRFVIREFASRNITLKTAEAQETLRCSRVSGQGIP